MAEITIAAKTPSAKFGASFMAYLATPPAGKGPGIVLIQEIFGVNKVMRDLADLYAAQGYVVACPDIFWRQQPGVQIEPPFVGQALQKMGNERCAQLANPVGAESSVKDKIASSAQIHGDQGQGFVHWHNGMAHTNDALAVAQRLGQRPA